MAASVAHDFNNLLAAILGRAELLRMAGEGGEAARGLEVIIKAAKDGGTIVRRLLNVARWRPADEAVGCDLNQIIEDAIEFTRPRWKGEAQRRGIHVEVVTRLERPCAVLGNAGELREVLTNIILNGLDAMPEGGRLAVESSHRMGEAVVAVSDSGAGMAPEVRENLFGSYFSTQGLGGTGLGMSLAFAIIERHHGRIEVESAPDKGTTMRLVLPAHPGAPACQGPGVSAGRGAGAADPTSILVVDDDPAVRAVLAEALRRQGHRVVETQDGQEALIEMEQGRFDLLVTDLGMPGMPGSELARRAKAAGKVPAVALITGWGVDGDDRTLRSLGVDLVLNKPFEIGDAVAQLVGLARRSGKDVTA
jgi:CheY-like chemotaxis protein